MSGTPGPSSQRFFRATSLIARTIYKELRRADYSHEDVLRFVNEVIDLLSKDAARVEAPPLIEPETGLPDRSVTLEILDFELRHLQTNGADKLAVVCVQPRLPSWCSGETHRSFFDIVAMELRNQVRRTDTLGRIAKDQFLLILPRGGEAGIDLVCRRIEAAVQAHGDSISPQAVIDVRWALCSGGTATEALERCLSCPSRALIIGSASSRNPSTMTTTSSAVERPRPPGGSAAPEGPRVVIALGGGAARAVGHIGVLGVLAEANIRVVGIAGTSAGALVGAMYAMGIPPSEIAARFTAFASSPLCRDMRRRFASQASSLRRLKGKARFFREGNLAIQSDSHLFAIPQEDLLAFIEYFVGPDRSIASLSVPFAVCATDLVEGRPVALSYGSLHAALAATCAVSGLFPPQQIGDRVLVDGSPVTEVPVQTAKMLCVDCPVLAVHLDRPSHRVPTFASSVEVQARVTAMVHAELVREQLKDAPLLLSIPVQEIGWLDFRKAATTLAIGEEAARKALDGLLMQLDAYATRTRLAR